MKIINKTNLCYAEIGLLIDNVIKSSYNDTIYYGKIEVFVVNFGSQEIKVQIRYLKRYVEWIFNEVE